MPLNNQKTYKESTPYYWNTSFPSRNDLVSNMITRLHRSRMEEMERLKESKKLKKVKLKKKLHPRVKLGLMRMGFDIEHEKEN